jgi:hypothetical protein
VTDQASNADPKPGVVSADAVAANGSKLRILNIVDLETVELRRARVEADEVLTGAANAYEIAVAAYAVGIFSKAFLETLGKRAADGAADLPRRAGELVRRSVRRKDETVEVHIGTGDDRAAVIVVTEDLPDEARLALLDLDVTADEVRGNVLHWNTALSAWLPRTTAG